MTSLFVSYCLLRPAFKVSVTYFKIGSPEETFLKKY